MTTMKWIVDRFHCKLNCTKMVYQSAMRCRFTITWLSKKYIISLSFRVSTQFHRSCWVQPHFVRPLSYNPHIFVTPFLISHVFSEHSLLTRHTSLPPPPLPSPLHYVHEVAKSSTNLPNIFLFIWGWWGGGSCQGIWNNITDQNRCWTLLVSSDS